MSERPTRPRLPGTREALLQRHAQARRARSAAELGSEAFRDAAEELGQIEVEIARIERAMTPPRG